MRVAGEGPFNSFAVALRPGLACQACLSAFVSIPSFTSSLEKDAEPVSGPFYSITLLVSQGNLTQNF